MNKNVCDPKRIHYKYPVWQFLIKEKHIRKTAAACDLFLPMKIFPFWSNAAKKKKKKKLS